MPSPSKPRAVFFGSADFAGPSLSALAGVAELSLVVSPPPAPAGRGKTLTPTPVAAMAVREGWPLLETPSVRAEDSLGAIRAARPDLLVVAAFGGFLPKTLLELCPNPPLNVHPSLLPRHRGPAPVNWTLIEGDEEAGVSIIFLEERMDAGPVLAQASLPLTGRERAGELQARLAEMGATELVKAIRGLADGSITPKPQNEALATVNPLLSKKDGRLDFSQPARRLAGRINGVDPWPGAQCLLDGRAVKLFGAVHMESAQGQAVPGQALGLDSAGRLMIAAGSGLVAVERLQPEGKKIMPAADFQRGYRPELFTGYPAE